MGPGRGAGGGTWGEESRRGKEGEGREGEGRRGIRHRVLGVGGVSRSGPPQLIPHASEMNLPTSTLPNFPPYRNVSKVKGLL